MGDPGPTRATFPGAMRLFRFGGIDVFLHWSWLLVAAYEVRQQTVFHSKIWNIVEYLSLFGIVLLHEFGHALACRSVGGKAEKILLWPLGGVAYVEPPRRPGAVLWSIAAGPLVNVFLVPVFLGARIAFGSPESEGGDLDRYLFDVFVINLALLIFNMLPIYPLDGGQIVQSLLWFFVGQARSLAIAARIGLVGAICVVLLALWLGDMWLIILALFGASQSWSGIKRAKLMSAMLDSPRWPYARCPSCGESPPTGPRWVCDCGAAFDLFATDGRCPHCGAAHATAVCPLCRTSYPLAWWKTAPVRAPAGRC